MLLTLATYAAMVCGIRCPEPPRGRIADGIYTPSATWSGEAFVHGSAADLTLIVDRTAGRVMIEYDRPDGARVVERWTITDVARCTLPEGSTVP